LQRRHQPTEFGERLGREQVAAAGVGEDDAVAIGSAQQAGHLVHEPEIDARVSHQRPEVVVDPQPRDPKHGGGGEGQGGQPAGPAPVRGGRQSSPASGAWLPGGMRC
ncbi:MAG: hypothetical protein ACK559_26145, partial [bacterium]